MIYAVLTTGKDTVALTLAERRQRVVPFGGRERLLRHWSQRPTEELKPQLRVFSIERFPLEADLRKLTDRLLQRVGDQTDRVGAGVEVKLFAETSHYPWGRPLAEYVRRLRSMHRAFSYSTALEVVNGREQGIVPAGWRVLVSRREVATASLAASKDGTLVLDDLPADGLTKELERQLREISEWESRRVEEPGPPDELAMGTALVCFVQAMAGTPGRVVPVITEPIEGTRAAMPGGVLGVRWAEMGDVPQKPMRRSEMLGYYDPEP